MQPVKNSRILGLCVILPLVVGGGCLADNPAGLTDLTDALISDGQPLDQAPIWQRDGKGGGGEGGGGEGGGGGGGGGGITPDEEEFPAGAISYADAVIRYEPTHSGYNTSSHPQGRDPNAALGEPNYTGEEFQRTSLNTGGLLELAFTDNILVNSGDASADLTVFEIDGDGAEAFTLSVRADDATQQTLEAAGATGANEWFLVGRIAGGKQTVDLDAVFEGYDAQTLRFTGVRLVDDEQDGATGGIAPGADIDAVGANSTIEVQ